MDHLTLGQALSEHRAETHNENLTVYEKMLLNKFRLLNLYSQDKVIDYIDDLLESDIYKTPLE